MGRKRPISRISRDLAMQVLYRVSEQLGCWATCCLVETYGVIGNSHLEGWGGQTSKQRVIIQDGPFCEAEAVSVVENIHFKINSPG